MPVLILYCDICYESDHTFVYYHSEIISNFDLTFDFILICVLILYSDICYDSDLTFDLILYSDICYDSDLIFGLIFDLSFVLTLI